MDNEFVWIIIAMIVICSLGVIASCTTDLEKEKTAQIELQLKIEMAKAYSSTNNVIEK